MLTVVLWCFLEASTSRVLAVLLVIFRQHSSTICSVVDELGRCSSTYHLVIAQFSRVMFQTVLVINQPPSISPAVISKMAKDNQKRCLFHCQSREPEFLI